jgi:hypothetical protein
MMTKIIFVCTSIFILVTAIAPALADCEASMQKLEVSNAEGEERLREKNEVIELCGRQYQRDTTIKRLVTECAKYEEQPVVKQQLVAECQLAAFNYANALRTLKAEYKR